MLWITLVQDFCSLKIKFTQCPGGFRLNTLDNTDTETIPPLRFRLYWLFSCDAGGYAISRQNNLALHLGCHTCWLSYLTLVCLRCGVYGHVIIKFSGMGRFTYPWCSTGESSAIKGWLTQPQIFWQNYLKQTCREQKIRPDLFSRPNLHFSRATMALKCDRRWLLFFGCTYKAINSM